MEFAADVSSINKYERMIWTSPLPIKLLSSNTNTDGAPKRVSKTCSYEGCTKKAQAKGLCHSHGASKHGCRHPGCSSWARQGGLCVTHGGRAPPKKECSHEGCTRGVIRGGVCNIHGAAELLQQPKYQQQIQGYPQAYNPYCHPFQYHPYFMGQYVQPGYYPPPNYHQGQVVPFPPSVKTTNAVPAKQLSVGKDANETSTISTTKTSKDSLAKETEATETHKS